MMHKVPNMQLSDRIRLGGRSGVLAIVIAGMALTGCGAMHQASRFYDAAFPAPLSNIDDVMILDVMDAKTTVSVHMDSGRILCRYELHQAKEFTCRIDKESSTVKSAKLYDQQLGLIAELDRSGKPSATVQPGTYVLEVISQVR